jgi:hypothetical protein
VQGPRSAAPALDEIHFITYLTVISEVCEMIRYPMLINPAGSATLAGSAMGRQMLAQMIEKTRPMAQPTIALLDFAETPLV